LVLQKRIVFNDIPGHRVVLENPEIGVHGADDDDFLLMEHAVVVCGVII
jgi:hypothetical protein